MLRRQLMLALTLNRLGDNATEPFYYTAAVIMPPPKQTLLS